MDSADASGPVLRPADYHVIISPTSFYVMNWVFFGLCTIACAVRAYIRYVCFGRLLFDDYVMVIALALHNAEAIIIQIFVHYMYDVEDIQRGDLSKFGPDLRKGIVAIGACVFITNFGVALVKLNYLLFFRRLGANLRMFNIIWWAVLLFTVATTAAQLGVQTFDCYFGPLDYIFGLRCTDEAAVRRAFFNAIFTAVVDALSDLLIFIFPVMVLWRSGVDFRKKLILTFIFSLVFLTIAITIVRGSVFQPVYSTTTPGKQERMQSATFIWFMMYCEYSVAILVACAISFRSLFVQREKLPKQALREQQRREEAAQSAARRGVWLARARFNIIQENVLETCQELEGWSGSEADSRAMRGMPPGFLDVDSRDDDNWRKPGSVHGDDGASTTEISVERPALTPSPLQTSYAASVLSVGQFTDKSSPSVDP